jgi:hypothetical protein
MLLKLKNKLRIIDEGSRFTFFDIKAVLNISWLSSLHNLAWVRFGDNLFRVVNSFFPISASGNPLAPVFASRLINIEIIEIRVLK